MSYKDIIISIPPKYISDHELYITKGIVLLSGKKNTYKTILLIDNDFLVDGNGKLIYQFPSKGIKDEKLKYRWWKLFIHQAPRTSLAVFLESISDDKELNDFKSANAAYLIKWFLFQWDNKDEIYKFDKKTTEKTIP